MTRTSIDIATELNRFNSDAAIDSAETPPASWYTTEAFYALERDAVFKPNWQFVGRVDQVSQPGDFFSGIFMGWPYVVVRASDGSLNAYYNVCSHHGTCVAKGEGNCSQFVCPYHGWTYDLSGALKQAPRAGALAILKSRSLDLKPIHVDTWGPFVGLHFGTPQGRLQDALAPLLKTFSAEPFKGMQFIRRVPYEIPCNWKVYVDNYLDGGYHVPHLHPDLSGQLDIASYQTTVGAQWSMQACGGKDDARVGEQADYAWIHPNFMIDRYGPWLNTITVTPVAVNRCLTVLDYYYEGTPEIEFLDSSLKASDKVQQEDMDICQRVQTGLQSGVYQQGVYAPKFEGPMFQFHKLLASNFRRSF